MTVETLDDKLNYIANNFTNLHAQLIAQLTGDSSINATIKPLSELNNKSYLVTINNSNQPVVVRQVVQSNVRDMCSHGTKIKTHLAKITHRKAINNVGDSYIEVLPYYKSTPKQYCTSLDNENKDEKKAALEMAIEMGKILEDLQNKNWCFIDAKSSNWLLKDDNSLVIADTKSLSYFSDNTEKSSISLSIERSPQSLIDKMEDNSRSIAVNKQLANDIHVRGLAINLLELYTGKKLDPETINKITGKYIPCSEINKWIQENMLNSIDDSLLTPLL